jgi:hypothetical protein
MNKSIRFLLRAIEIILASINLYTVFFQIKLDLKPMKIVVFSLIMLIETYLFQSNYNKRKVTTFLFIYVIILDIINFVAIVFFSSRIIGIVYLISVITLIPLIVSLFIRNISFNDKIIRDKQNEKSLEI